MRWSQWVGPECSRFAKLANGRFCRIPVAEIAQRLLDFKEPCSDAFTNEKSFERPQEMSKFESVNVVKAANVYFDGKVSSRTVEFADGSTKTLGLMLPGEYTFNTDKPELMEITSGQVSYCLAGEDAWNDVSGGQSFNVPGSSSFHIKVAEITDYICSFIDE